MLDKQNLIRRIVSGLLTASMVLPMAPTVGAASGTEAEAAQSRVAAMPSRAELVSRQSSQRIALKESGNGSVAMPITLDKSFVGFTADSDKVEVTATMTDIQYLGVLTLEEYAAFIPASVNVERVTYLNHSQRQYIDRIPESQRLSLRAQA